MANNTVAQMTQSELKELLEAVVETTVEEKLLEILGDPDEGMELREAIRDRLIRQRQAVTEGQYGQTLQDVARELGLE
jgi:vacuolar-type H+-ATPase subunit E/Vma4